MKKDGTINFRNFHNSCFSDYFLINKPVMINYRTDLSHFLCLFSLIIFLSPTFYIDIFEGRFGRQYLFYGVYVKKKGLTTYLSCSAFRIFGLNSEIYRNLFSLKSLENHRFLGFFEIIDFCLNLGIGLCIT